jgi:hypothetical protein
MEKKPLRTPKKGLATPLLKKMRYTKKVSVWPVAFVGELFYEAPLVQNGKVIYFYN